MSVDEEPDSPMFSPTTTAPKKFTDGDDLCFSQTQAKEPKTAHDIDLLFGAMSQLCSFENSQDAQTLKLQEKLTPHALSHLAPSEKTTVGSLASKDASANDPKDSKVAINFTKLSTALDKLFLSLDD